jgi:hypothetical protein
VFATSGTETTLAAMSNQFEMTATFTLIDMATQNGCTASQDLADIFKNNRSDPPFVLSYELEPMHSKYGRNMITDMSCGAQHNLYLE